jgi:NAD(P)-dependent dehydrogenase (short-subunit alcohol dehydrogenase family)
MTRLSDLFSLDGKVAVVTGSSGAIGQVLAEAAGVAGARVALLARRPEPLARQVDALRAAGVDAAAWPVDVLDEAGLAAARDDILEQWGQVDVLLNVAGGNVPAATLPDAAGAFDIGLDAYRAVIELNLLGTIAAVQAFGPALAAGAGDRSIVNISSMASARAMTRVGGYGAAKAAIESLTRSMAVELARRGTGIRVNAIAPGFLIGEQNRALLMGPDGSLTDRGRTIIVHTPLGRLGEADDLASTALWLCGPGARFVTGIVVPVDGGFSAFSGV